MLMVYSTNKRGKSLVMVDLVSQQHLIMFTWPLLLQLLTLTIIMITHD